MAEFDNISEINENFDTIKTLLNSIRAQGILNTSDVDKLLTGINTKLEKINTEEDIDLIKIFLSELKQTMEERHGVLVSKFAAIETLFSDLLKNTSENLKTSEIKELFDIVATNLSVFSREIVSQKESLTDISLRLETMRSDDSTKKDIIKNITLLKPDLERLNNGFDSIVLSLNDNFKAIIKTITTIDKSEHLDKFADSLASIEMSSNTLLSAIQVLDKKAEQVDVVLQNVYTKEDANATKQLLSDLTRQSQNLQNAVGGLSDGYVRIDKLADKIDASVSIIASLKAGIEEVENKNSQLLYDKLTALAEEVNAITTDTKFDDFKTEFQEVLTSILNKSSDSNDEIKLSRLELAKIITLLESLQIDINIDSLKDFIKNETESVKSYIDDTHNKSVALADANVSKVITDITANAEALNSKILQSQGEVSRVCEKSFGTVYENISELKNILNQIDENSVSANNAIFSNITDRLTTFETDLRSNMDTQEQNITQATAKLIEQVDNIKNIAGVLDYKIDSSALEIGGVKTEFESLKTSVNDVLALDFVNAVKELRADLYASKQELETKVLEESASVNSKLAEELSIKYQLLLENLNATEKEISNAQLSSLSEIKNNLDSLTSSMVDVISYLNEIKGSKNDELDFKLSEVVSSVKESSLNYVENVRDVVNVIKIQIEEKLKEVEENSKQSIELIQKGISTQNAELREDLKYSYSKILELQDACNNLKNTLDSNGVTYSEKFEALFNTADVIKQDYQMKLDALFEDLIEKIADFKQSFNAQSIQEFGELKESVQNAKTKNSEEMNLLIFDLRSLISELNTEDKTLKSENLAKILENFVELKGFIEATSSGSKENVAKEISAVIQNLDELKDKVSKFDENVDSDLSMQLSIIERNFESFADRINELFANSDNNISEKINREFDGLSDEVCDMVSQKLTNYEERLSQIFEDLNKKALSRAEDLSEKVTSLNNTLQTISIEQTEKNLAQLGEISDYIKDVLSNSKEMLDSDFGAIEQKLEHISEGIKSDNAALLVKADEVINTALINKTLVSDLEETLSNKFDAVSTASSQNFEEKIVPLKDEIFTLSQKLEDVSNNISSEIENTSNPIKNLLSKNVEKVDEISETLIQEINSAIQPVISKTDLNTDKINEISETLIQEINSAIQPVISKADLNADKIDEISETLTQEIQSVLQPIISEIGLNTDKINELSESISRKIFESTESINAVTSQIDDKIGNISSIVYQSILNGIEPISGNFADIKEALAVSTDNINGEVGIVNEHLMSMSDKIDSVISENSRVSEQNVRAVKEAIYTINENIELEKQSVETCKDLIIKVLEDEIKGISKEIQGETDAVVSIIMEQFDNLRSAQSDDVINLSSRIEEIVSSQVYTNIEDLKAYLDVKNNSADLTEKFDNLKISMVASIDELSSNMGRILEAEAFTTAMSDYRLATEVLVNSAVDRLNEKYETFIAENLKQLENKIADNSKAVESTMTLFDKKFCDTVIDKYEEIKLMSNKTNETFDNISSSINDIISSFSFVKEGINKKIDNLLSSVLSSFDDTKNEINVLTNSFEDLKKQISNKKFEESFQISIEKQIGDLESLVNEQMGYVQDINDLCLENLPDIPKLEASLKGSIIEAVNNITSKLESQDIDGILECALNNLKSEIIKQFLNVFNQISFVAEQEEILDFIDEKHSMLISELSHIITQTETVDKKIESVKNDISAINEKINSILSSDGDIDYVYSLQDLESDIANLRLVLNEMKQNNASKEIADLAKSTDEIYSLVDSIKSELPTKKDIENIAEDIISISSRTNRLLLASDESYKTLQDNLKDFKLVINDLDERTRNFAQESGMDRLDSKLNAMNTMIQNGAKTNQVFNQVFEYLAEWVDNAGNQINAISDKVNNLDDITQIKKMLSDLKMSSDENSASAELVDALGTIFNKQAKKMAALETKIDKMIVENAIYNKDREIDTKPFETTLNKFLVSLSDKLFEQQSKVALMEEQMSKILETIEKQETTTKKISSMDKQISKLNKNIEKLTTNAVK